MSRNMNRNRDGPMQQRRSQSSHQPYHAISEVYSKEVTTRPLGPVDDFPPEVVNILRESDRNVQTPPLRSRENTWTTENFPIVRVPSAQFTDILTELYDYREKYTRKSISLSPEPELENLLRRQSEFKEMPLKIGGKSEKNPPIYQVIPPTPEKTPRDLKNSKNFKNDQKNQNQGIPLSRSLGSGSSKRPLPMYEEYVQEVLKKSESSQNTDKLPPIPRPRSKSPGASRGVFQGNGNNLRHIDSSSSESNVTSEEPREPRDPQDPRRYVYSHDVFVDSNTGRPYTPGRADLDEKSCGKLKINVYFKPPHPPIEPTYTLDEIEIEKQEDILVSKLRPSRSSTILAGSEGLEDTNYPNNPKNPEEMTTRRIPTRTTLLRKENEVLTVPLHRSQSVRHSRTSDVRSSSTSSSTKTVSERTIPIHVDDGFTRIPRHPEHQALREQREQQRELQREQEKKQHKEKGNPDYPRQKYPATNPNVRSPSFHSHAPTKIVQSLSSSRAAEVIIDRRPIKPRLSPEELSYGKVDRNQEIEVLPYTRGISKTPSVPDNKSTRSSFKSTTTLPVYPTKDQGDRHHNQSRNPSIHQEPRGERDERHSHHPHGRTSVYSNRPVDVEERPQPIQHRPSYTRPVELEDRHSKTSTPILPPPSYPKRQEDLRSERSVPQSHVQTRQNSIQDLPYTRGISKTPSVPDSRESERSPSKVSSTHNNPNPNPNLGAPIHIPYNHEKTDDRTHRPTRPVKQPHARSPSIKSRHSSAHTSRPGNQPFEEIVHIKERYERDETIRRFFPTTTSV